MAYFMPVEHVDLLEWQGYFSTFNHEGLRNLKIIILSLEALSIVGMLFKPLFFRNVLLFSMMLWIVDGMVGGYYVSTPLVNMVASIQHIFISLTLGFAFFANHEDS